MRMHLDRKFSEYLKFLPDAKYEQLFDMKNPLIIIIACGLCVATSIIAHRYGFKAGALETKHVANAQIGEIKKVLEETKKSLVDTTQTLEKSKSIVIALTSKNETLIKAAIVRENQAKQESLGNASATSTANGLNQLVADGRVVASISQSGSELFVPNGVYIPTDNKFLLNTQAITEGKKSGLHGEKSKISFTNNTNEDLYLFWVDFDGKPTFSEKLKPGMKHSGITYVSHVHVLTKTNGEVFSFIEPQAGTDTLDIRSQ